MTRNVNRGQKTAKNSPKTVVLRAERAGTGQVARIGLKDISIESLKPCGSNGATRSSLRRFYAELGAEEGLQVGISETGFFSVEARFPEAR